MKIKYIVKLNNEEKYLFETKEKAYDFISSLCLKDLEEEYVSLCTHVCFEINGFPDYTPAHKKMKSSNKKIWL